MNLFRRLAAVAVLLLVGGAAGADETILSFDSDIVIREDGSLLVTETIVVRAEGNRIWRGIYRDFPTDYRDRYGNDVVVEYQPLSVLRNEAPEDFFSERMPNGLRTYFGSSDRMLPTGIHTYEFRYRVNRVLGYFSEHDELYWNVTGLDWAFAVQSASATVTLDLPGNPRILSAEAYTGYTGGQGRDYESEVSGAQATYRTTRVLEPHEGITIVATWPKGLFSEPTPIDRAGWVLKDNFGLLIIVGALAVLLAYLLPVWKKFGKDPDEGVIVTRYEPPEALSPASLRYINQMYYDNKTTTAAILNLAVKGCLRIEEHDGTYTLVHQRPDSDVELTASERSLYDKLFEGGTRLELDKKNHRRVGGARKAHRRALNREFRGKYFRLNAILSLPAFAVTVIASFWALRSGTGPTPLVIAGIATLFAVTGFFSSIMRRPTIHGRKTLDAVLGFREYLEIAEKDELNLRNPPERTPELFERFLPYALALGVEQRWSERFSTILGRSAAGAAGTYQPAWYTGEWDGFDIGGTTSAIGSSMSSAISSSSSPPGSSSGSGGGGSSGGGGGGGGGGGW